MPNYDAIRLAAIVAIVLLHTAANGVNRLAFDSADWWLANAVDSACRAGVPLFLMLTGALFLPRPQLPARPFYRRRWQRLALPLLGWSLFYLIWSAAKAHWKGQPYGLNDALDQLQSGAPYYHLWFIFMLVGIYALLPMLNRCWQRLSKGQQTVLTLSALLLQQSGHLFSFLLPLSAPEIVAATGFDIPWPLWFIGYLPYLLLGAWLAGRMPLVSKNAAANTTESTAANIAESTAQAAETSARKNSGQGATSVMTYGNTVLCLLLFAGISSAIALLYFGQRAAGLSEPFYYAYHRMSLPVLLAAIAAWQLLSTLRWQPGPLGQLICQHSLGIYCAHPLLLDLSNALSDLGNALLAQNPPLPYGLQLPLQAGLVLVGSLTLAMALAKLPAIPANNRSKV